ncbi:unnamed protein product [Prorocentrum cordatum]|uniref:Secreted protein n=1 Tax=Prorocentrum cordatum TaxID=2364126 RepID=A0ABN9VPB4_9DINO|nr:unnamed protein product [Polarella glacialis]
MFFQRLWRRCMRPLPLRARLSAWRAAPPDAAVPPTSPTLVRPAGRVVITVVLDAGRLLHGLWLLLESGCLCTFNSKLGSLPSMLLKLWSRLSATIRPRWA